jgi:phosphoribosyl-dephospho-CoA transferase
VTPYSLATPGNWKAVYCVPTPETIRSLQLITPLMQQTGCKWGPTGSAGFELATGISTLSDSSDLDLLIDFPEFISVQSATLLLNKLKKIATVNLDIQMGTPTGGVALKEYVKSEDVLIKTFTVPVIQSIRSLWN